MFKTRVMTAPSVDMKIDRQNQKARIWRSMTCVMKAFFKKCKI